MMADVAGLDGLTAAIAAMNADLRSALPAVALAGAAIVEAEIAARAPHRTGALIASLDEQADSRRNSAGAVVQVEDSAQGGVEHYAIFQEYGTSKMPAHPFFRPGVEAAKPKVAAAMSAELQKVISSHDR
jgi:HK97 gp10 family phage protein